MQAAPSAPSDTQMPRRRSSGTGARPLPSFRLEPGQCRTLTRARAIMACSRSSTHTQCATQSRWRRQADRRRSTAMLRRPVWPLDEGDLRLLLRRVRVDQDSAASTRATRLPRAGPASTTGRTAARTPHGYGRWRRRPTGGAAPGSRRSPCGSARTAGRAPAASASIRHLPITARIPAAATASKTASVSCTVSIVSTVVVPVESSSQAARRAEARSEAGVCAASIGQIRWRSQSISCEVVGKAPEQRLAEVDVGLDETGQHERAGGVDDAIEGRWGDAARPTRCGRRGSTTSPSTMSRRSFIVRMVPPRMSREAMAATATAGPAWLPGASPDTPLRRGGRRSVRPRC